LNARITFGNIFSFDEPVKGVTPIKDESESACVVEESIFETPPGYRILGNNEQRQWSIDDEDELLQMAIQQYLVEEGSGSDQVTLWEALKQPDADLQRFVPGFGTSVANQYFQRPRQKERFTNYWPMRALVISNFVKKFFVGRPRKILAASNRSSHLLIARRGFVISSDGLSNGWRPITVDGCS